MVIIYNRAGYIVNINWKKDVPLKTGNLIVIEMFMIEESINLVSFDHEE